VITTSGTAAAELLPAVIEADYQGLPLIAVTADRPRRYRGSGAPQTIVQPGLFSVYVERVHDLQGDLDGLSSPDGLGGLGEIASEWSRKRPLHINVCFDEPLLDEELKPWTWPAGEDLSTARAPDTTASLGNLQGVRRPLVIASGLPEWHLPSILPKLKSWQRPVYLEAPSGLRGHPDLADLEIRGGESVLKHLEFDAVIRIGSVPTLRFWRDLESSKIPVFHYSHLPYSGLPRAPHVEPLEAFPGPPSEIETFSRAANLAENRAANQTEPLYEMSLARNLERFPLSEPGWVRWLSRQIPAKARLFIGNSLPIREWDLAADREMRPRVFCNRGVNGIDGLISTFLGTCEPGESNWALVGDLSALYDLSAPWALGTRREPVTDVNLVILNNGGGKIFERLFNNSLFENRHAMDFSHWAKMWNWDYLRLQEAQSALSPAPKASGRPRVIEILPDAESTRAFWRAYERPEQT
jgi:2-succinyl-5-enolpyruvyl-6-hydroxy-3-cyclohexene-1-carboxylate synthase